MQLRPEARIITGTFVVALPKEYAQGENAGKNDATDCILTSESNYHPPVLKIVKNYWYRVSDFCFRCLL